MNRQELKSFIRESINNSLLNEFAPGNVAAKQEYGVDKLAKVIADWNLSIDATIDVVEALLRHERMNAPATELRLRNDQFTRYEENVDSIIDMLESMKDQT